MIAVGTLEVSPQVAPGAETKPGEEDDEQDAPSDEPIGGASTGDGITTIPAIPGTKSPGSDTDDSTP